MDVVNVVVTCTKDKKFPVDADCALRALPPGTVRQRCSEWRQRLSARGRQRVRVEELYSGDHWSTVRSFRSSHFDIQTWVCSAGYGLVGMHDLVTPYSATFSANHPDSVMHNTTGASECEIAKAWWKNLAKWRGHARGNPRSLHELAAEYPSRFTLIVASETYLKAISEDLHVALGELADPDLLSIISAGSKHLDGLNEHLIPCDARLQALVNGARRSLNTRVARTILSEARVVPRNSTLKKKMRRLLAEQPDIERIDRAPMSDAEVKQFIALRLREDARLCHTPLLRRFRASGHACEQSRFAALYRSVKEQMNGAT